jgi:predicted RNA-binding Zn-ribbon protein involved in translation (DUF1610 family)
MMTAVGDIAIDELPLGLRRAVSRSRTALEIYIETPVPCPLCGEAGGLGVTRSRLLGRWPRRVYRCAHCEDEFMAFEHTG